MSLTTTMGIELTYVPKAVQIAKDRGAVFDNESAPGERDLLDGYHILMWYLVRAKKIPVYSVSRDPGVVEIPTMPYRKISSLLSVARRLRIEAEAIGLSTELDYTGGGGAHIHTGLIGEDYEARELYKKRMALYVALNPWFTWATVGVTDYCNAAPITRAELLHEKSDGVAELRYLINNARADIAAGEKREHSRIHYSRFHENNMLGRRSALRSLMKKLLAEIKRDEVSTTPIDTISYIGDKDHALRFTDYGDNGTAEFRCFEMGDEAKLKRNIILANAICSFVEKWEINEFNLKDVMDATQLEQVTWGQAKRGWLAMLEQLDLDPEEYREETAQLAYRWRVARELGESPCAVDESRSSVGYSDAAADMRAEEYRARDAIRKSIARYKGREERQVLAKEKRTMKRRERRALKAARKRREARLAARRAALAPKSAADDNFALSA